MRTKFFRSIIAASAAAILSAGSVFAAPSAAEVNLPAGGAVILQDETPEITAKVARISFLSGEARIRRGSDGEWETVVNNLPLVEGDEIATDANTRLEIQFDLDRFARLDGNSYLRITGLKDEGIALSLPLGTMSLRVRTFGRSGEFIEIDAPKTTIAVLKEGSYRVDSGDDASQSVRVTVTDGGEARVYSDNAGFALKSGRSAEVFTTGNAVGEFQTGDASRFANEFDTWVAGRDRSFTTRYTNAHYDSYYDRDIYGADELTENGDWSYLNDYGYVWRPSTRATVSYSNWSPYRYGQWRWMPPYGWIWVNDEPWGWATYHHGRWFHHRGVWYWSPYGAHRYSRSWWYPGLVAFHTIGNNVCWYPLPYHYGFVNYNSYYINYYGWRNGRWRNPRHGKQTPLPAPIGSGPIRTGKQTPLDPPGGGGPIIRTDRDLSMTDLVPVSGVVGVSKDDFAARARGDRKLSADVATQVIKRPINASDERILPDRTAVAKGLDGGVRADAPQMPIRVRNNDTGAMTRRPDQPMDAELQKSRINNGREPRVVNNTPVRNQPVDTGIPGGNRSTGVFERQLPAPTRVDRSTTPPVRTPSTDRAEPVRPQPPANSPSSETKPPTRSEPVRPQPPVNSPPTRTQPPTRSEPVRPQPPASPPPTRTQPPTRSEPVRPQPPASPPPTRTQPPTRSEPVRPQPPARTPPPSRSQPSKPAPKQEAPKSESRPSRPKSEE